MTQAPPGPPPVVYEDDDLLVVDKPTGLATTSPDDGDCLVRRVQSIVPDGERLHPTSRLDAEVTGLVTFARTRRATKALLAARAAGDYNRLYIGISEAAPHPERGRHQAAISIDRDNPRRRQISTEDAPTAKPAVTRYALWSSADAACLVCLWPETGRTHQLRVHMADLDCPLLGDRHYGGPRRLVLSSGRVVRAARVMLHCHRLTLPRPDGAGLHQFESPIPADMHKLWALCGGDAEALTGFLDADGRPATSR